MKKTISTILTLALLAAPLSGSACFADTPKINTGFIETAISDFKALRSKLYSSSNDTCKTLFEKTGIAKSIIDYQLKFADQHNFDLCKVFESLSKFSLENYVMTTRHIGPDHLEYLLEYAKNHKVKLYDIIKYCADKIRGDKYREESFIYDLNCLAGFLNRNPQDGELREFYERYSNQQQDVLSFISEI